MKFLFTYLKKISGTMLYIICTYDNFYLIQKKRKTKADNI